MLREGIEAAISRQPDMVMVGEAVNGRDAIEIFRKTLPDVTLMDLQMPEMNGVDAISTIRADFPGARISGESAGTAASRSNPAASAL